DRSARCRPGHRGRTSPGSVPAGSPSRARSIGDPLMTPNIETTPLPQAPTATVTGLLSEIAGTGTDTVRGGYTRPVYSTAELDLRNWFIEQASKRGLAVETDG